MPDLVCYGYPGVNRLHSQPGGDQRGQIPGYQVSEKTNFCALIVSGYQLVTERKIMPCHDSLQRGTGHSPSWLTW